MTILIDNSGEAAKKRVRHPEKAARPESEILRKPKWIRGKAPTSRGYAQTRKIVKDKGLVTVCEEAACPNIGECWEKSHATFMVLGEICTRACAFCNVATGLPQEVDAYEPSKIAEAVTEMALKHVVITSVDRDDLDDGGAQHFVNVISQFTKSGLMVGLGETKEEIMQVMDDMRSAGIDFLTIGQYLQPTRRHAAIDRFVTPQEFKTYETIAKAKGFLLVSASPLTRSSYHADSDFAKLQAARRNHHAV